MPTPTLTYTVQTRSGASGVLPLPVQARVVITAATDEAGNPVTYPSHDFHFVWDFGDTATAAAAEVMFDPLVNQARRSNTEQIGPQACHTYTVPGTYTITVRAFYYATDTESWVEVASASSSPIAVTDPADTTDWEQVYVNPGSTSSNSYGTLADPFKTLAEVRAAVLNAQKLAVYFAVGSELTSGDNAPVLLLRDHAGIRLGTYVPAGAISASSPVLKMYASASGKAVISVAPSTVANAQNEKQLITIDSASSGTFTLTFKGDTTTALDWDASDTDIQTALRALPSIGGTNVNVTGVGPYTVEFVVGMASSDEPMITATYVGTLNPAEATVVVTRIQNGSGNIDTVTDVVVSGLRLDANRTTSSRCFEIVPLAGNEGYAQDVYLRDCKLVNAKSQVGYVANVLDGGNGPKGIGFIRTEFDHTAPASAGHSLYLSCMQYAAVVGCSFRGGNGTAATDNHIHVPQFSTTQTQTDMLFRWNGTGVSPQKGWALLLQGGATQAWVFGNSFTGCRSGVQIDKLTGDAVTHPKDVIVEGNSFHNLGIQPGDQAIGLMLRFTTNVSARNNLFYENGYDLTTTAGADINIADALGAEEAVPDVAPLRIEHNSFFRSWARSGSPHVLIDDYRFIRHFNNAYHYQGAPNGSSPHRAVIRFTDGSYSAVTRFSSNGNVYYAPNLLRAGVSKPFVMGGSAFVEFNNADATVADWKNNNVGSGSNVFDVNGAYADPEFRNPVSGNFRFSAGDALADFDTLTPRRTRFDFRLAVRSAIPDCGAFEFDGAAATVPYAYQSASLTALPTANAWDYRNGDIRYIELNEPVEVTDNPNTDVDNRPSHNLAFRDNILGASMDGLLADVNSAFCSPPQEGSQFTAAHPTIASFMSVGHYPDGTLRLSGADLSVLGFLRTDGTNYMLGNLDVGEHRVTRVSPAEDVTDAPQLQQVVQRTGDSVFGDILFDGTGLVLDMGSNRIANLPNAVGAGEPLVFGQAILTTGGSITGSLSFIGDATQVLDMGAHRIVNLHAASNPGDAPRSDQVVFRTGVFAMTGNFDVGGNRAINVGPAVAVTDAPQLQQVVKRAGDTMAGALVMRATVQMSAPTEGGLTNGTPIDMRGNQAGQTARTLKAGVNTNTIINCIYPSDDGDVANKAYVDDTVANPSLDLLDSYDADGLGNPAGVANHLDYNSLRDGTWLIHVYGTNTSNTGTVIKVTANGVTRIVDHNHSGGGGINMPNFHVTLLCIVNGGSPNLRVDVVGTGNSAAGIHVAAVVGVRVSPDT